MFLLESKPKKSLESANHSKIFSEFRKMLTFQKLRFLQRNDHIFYQKHLSSAYHWQGNLLLLGLDDFLFKLLFLFKKITAPDLKGHQT